MSDEQPESLGAVRYAVEDRVATITIDRPWAHNAMTEVMYAELVEACERAEADENVRVAVLRGAGGRAFASGSDIRQFLDFDSAGQDGLEYERRIASYFAHVETLRVPTIAVVEGYAVGGGLGLAMACDLRVCTPRAKFGLPIARTLGNAVSMAAYARLAELIGVAHALELIYLAELIGAEEAARVGLVTRVVEEEQLRSTLAEMTATIAAHAPITLEVTKTAYRRLREHEMPNDEDLLRRAYGSADFHEGVQSFLEKRPARWQRR
ncbi:enoyl-CoA hydratase [Microbacterium sp. LRZ72]|uniref:enoyl-CoA hydratase n=1 Tax=Microbacterium sp. LRZ72 TaxID=2942481 RepID=UPI0029A03DAF|nr:enoyl-CoA hydratase [Microbacterium sp. LRZ72]MDX2377559.1 enoyl-CoA hydratase [Microbacterium sp. LRZ72]